MKRSVSAIFSAAILDGVLAGGGATASAGEGPKMVEIDEAGNVRTTSGTDIGRTTSQVAKRDPASAPEARERNPDISICDPRYRWLPTGVSPDTAARTRAFYRDETQKYERAQHRARESGVPRSREREIEYWNEYKRFLDAVPQNERKVVERGTLPRLSWWCNAPPVIQKPVNQR